MQHPRIALLAPALAVAITACLNDFREPEGTGGEGGSGGGRAGGMIAGKAGASAGSGGTRAGSAGAPAGMGGVSPSGGAPGGNGGALGGSGGAPGGNGGALGGNGGAPGGSGGTLGGSGGALGGNGGTLGGSGGASGNGCPMSGVGGNGGVASGGGGAAGGSVTAQGRVYAVSGSQLAVYDSQSKLWTTTASAPETPVALTTLGGFLYAGGKLGAFYRFTPASNTWDSRAPTPHVGGPLPSFVASDAHVYAISGSGVQRYDPCGDSWTKVGPAPPNGTGGISSYEYFGGNIYKLGGAFFEDSNQWATAIRRFDVTTGQWNASPKKLPPPVAPFDYSDLRRVGSRLYALGGHSTAQVYDPATNELSLGWLPQPERSLSMVADPPGDFAFFYAGNAAPAGTEFRRCNLLTNSCSSLSPPVSHAESNQWVYVP